MVSLLFLFDLLKGQILNTSSYYLWYENMKKSFICFCVYPIRNVAKFFYFCVRLKIIQLSTNWHRILYSIQWYVNTFVNVHVLQWGYFSFIGLKFWSWGILRAGWPTEFHWIIWYQMFSISIAKKPIMDPIPPK